MDIKLKDKRALVAGASRGLGYAAARGLALEGARVVINSRSSEHLAVAAEALSEQSGVDVHIVPGDV